MGTEKTNVLLITVDDMNYDSLGCFGSQVKNITPNIDALAAQGMRFDNGHVTIAVCQPSRSCLLTGRYPHHNGARGFEEIDHGVTTLPEVLSKNGYINGIIGKEDHVAPREKFAWDSYITMYNEENGYGRSPEKYYEKADEFFNLAKSEDKPFFLMINSHDPHRPFVGSDDEISYYNHHTTASYIYSEDEIDVPGCLPDLPGIRKELAQYFSSVHRADESVGKILEALKDNGMEDNTFVVFLSDNGMALPYAKTNCYLNSTKSPYVMRWPGRIKPGSTTDALITGVDYTPSVLDILGIENIKGVDGKSFLPAILEGEEHHKNIFTLFFKTNNNHITKRALHYPMRCVQDKRFAYIFNSWSNGVSEFLNESTEGLTFKAMEEAGKSDSGIQERVDFFKFRVVDEFYDYAQDPHALNNLIDRPEYRAKIAEFKADMQRYMEESKDPLLEDFYQKVMKTQ